MFGDFSCACRQVSVGQAVPSSVSAVKIIHLVQYETFLRLCVEFLTDNRRLLLDFPKPNRCLVRSSEMTHTASDVGSDVGSDSVARFG